MCAGAATSVVRLLIQLTSGVFKPPSPGTSGEASFLPLSFGLDVDFPRPVERPQSHPPVAHALNGRCSESKSKVGPKKNLRAAGMLLLAQFKGQSVVVVVWLLMFVVLKLLPEDQE